MNSSERAGRIPEPVNARAISSTAAVPLALSSAPWNQRS